MGRKKYSQLDLPLQLLLFSSKLRELECNFLCQLPATWKNYFLFLLLILSILRYRTFLLLNDQVLVQVSFR